VYEGRGWDRVGAHTFGYNDVAIGKYILGIEGHVPMWIVDDSRAVYTAQKNLVRRVNAGHFGSGGPM
jgi:hypothetical protein